MDDKLPTKMLLTVVTPEQAVVEEPVVAASVPGKEGELGILPGHAPLLSEIKPGELSYKVDSTTHYLAVDEGFLEVLPDRITVLVRASERAEAIDVDRARRAQHEADEALRSSDSEADREAARAALDRATARLQVAKRAGRS